MARADSNVFKVRAKMPAQWMSVYQYKIPEPGEDAETEDAADTIWKACEEHVGSQRFKSALKVLGEHITRLPSSTV